MTPDLLAKFTGEAEDAIEAITSLTHCADALLDDYLLDSGEKLEALETLNHAIRHLTPTVVAVLRVVRAEAERDASSSGASLYRSTLRLELSRLEACGECGDVGCECGRFERGC